MGGRMTVRGGRPLRGSVRVPAAKNSVLPLLAASALCGGPVRLRGVPRLSDVEDCLGLLRAVGCPAGWDGADLVCGGPPAACRLPAAESSRMRASILFAAPVLGRLGRVETVLPGGCRIGTRPVDLHLKGLARMGARADWVDQRLVLTAPGGLQAAEITLPLPSVGATETLVLAGCAARGRTVLHGAAREPEIVDLASFLNHCGAAVAGAGSGDIVIEGGRPLHPAAWTPMPDRIWASTLACAAASARGWVRLEGCPPALYAPVLDLLEAAGCTVLREADAAVVAHAGRLRGIGRWETGGYPALATDAAPLAAAALLGAEGETVFYDRVFEDRFGCAAGFAAMGADVEAAGRTLTIRSGRPLHAAAVTARDLRGGAALVMAALAARGASRVDGCEYIARGYEDLGGVLASLGAGIG